MTEETAGTVRMSEGVPPVRLKKSSRIMEKVATLTKVAVIGILVLVLLIPLGMIRRTMQERQYRYDQAVREVTATWGEQQEIIGPILVVPYSYERRVVKPGKDGRPVSIEEDAVGYAHFLPEKLDVSSELKHKILHRGIYEAVVFGGDVKVAGFFARPDFRQFGVERDKNIQWDKAYLTLAVSDMRGTREEIQVTFAGKACKVEPGCSLKDAGAGITAVLTKECFGADKLEFDVKLSLNGSGGIRFAPVGKQTFSRVISDWPDPSFQGGILPTERQITDKGFDAVWEVSYYGRNYPQAWTTADGGSQVGSSVMRDSLFGVDLINVVDSYRFVERSIKYGMLFIVLVFTAFFLFEVMSSLKVHPFQYVLVGAALCLFYMALLSLSEVVSFGRAYGIGALASELMISLYSAKILKSRARGVKVFAGLGAVYGVLYVILRQQDYSLVYGTVGLFAALAIVMYTTRNVDWYAKDRGERP